MGAQAERGELDVPRREVRGRADLPKHSRYPEATRREALSLLRKGLGPAAVARRTRRRRRWSSYAGETDARPANLPLGPDGRHDFSAPEPWRMAVTDVTEFKVRGGKAYLSPVIDCFDGEPAAWSVSRHPDSGLADSSLESYLARRPGGLGPLVEHSDGGSTYRSASWKRICEENGVVRSMSRRGAAPTTPAPRASSGR